MLTRSLDQHSKAVEIVDVGELGEGCMGTPCAIFTTFPSITKAFKPYLKRCSNQAFHDDSTISVNKEELLALIKWNQLKRSEELAVGLDHGELRSARCPSLPLHSLYFNLSLHDRESPR